MAKIIKVVKYEISNCVDCKWMSPTPVDPSKIDSDVALICSHPNTCRARGFAWKDRELGPDPIPAWCPLDNREECQCLG